ncbi:hypothetical protein Pth03_77930 [Planotetraspora thailandica]|uniref:Uncharacterized protein n=1 Tax=Planotetraspora thailandica TaxID=487172 RepID=A0A8J3Y283_9ACTN|nr:hypothetical protein [Planotetraspora thailandica]GII59404.1 hypothetical protein Pth03_77930 [Planotetraspora thailandica]
MLCIKINTPSLDNRVVVPLLVLVVIFVFLYALLQRGYTPHDVLLLVGGGCAAATTIAARLLPRTSGA